MEKEMTIYNEMRAAAERVFNRPRRRLLAG